MCALIYLCGISGNGFFVTLFEEEEEEEEEDPFFVRDFVLLSLSTQDRKT